MGIVREVRYEHRVRPNEGPRSRHPYDGPL